MWFRGGNWEPCVPVRALPPACWGDLGKSPSTPTSLILRRAMLCSLGLLFSPSAWHRALLYAYSIDGRGMDGGQFR